MSSSNAILDAAAELIKQRGVQGVRLAEVARQAGVSRPTVYRRWPDVHAIVASLLTREIQAVQASVPLELEALQRAIRAGQRAGTIRRGRATELAAMVLLITQSTVQSHRMVASILPDRAWRRELAHALEGYLAP
jgi:AcrR family transcriptional regulator